MTAECRVNAATHRSPEKRFQDSKFYVTCVLPQNKNKKNKKSRRLGVGEEELVSRGDASANNRDRVLSRSRPNLLLRDM